MRIVFERGCTQQEDVTAKSRDGCDRTPTRVTRVTGRAAKPLCFVSDQEINVRPHRMLGELRAFDQQLERDNRTTMNIERVEAGAKVASDVRQALGVDEREDLVIFP